MKKSKKNGKAKAKGKVKRVQKTIIRAAGGLLWRETKEGRKLAVVHRPYYDDWVLPKGKLDDGEGWEDAAVREVVEETNCEVALENFAGTISYMANGKPKIVLFWHMSLVEEQDFVPNGETDKLRWWTVEKALKKLEYDTERRLVYRNHSPGD